MTNTATVKQIEFINSLKTTRDIESVEAKAALNAGRTLWTLEQFTVEAASAVIDVLKATPKVGRDQSVESVATEAPEGMHKVGDRIYKVQRAVHGSGKTYAKILVLDEPDCGGCANGEPCGAGCTWTSRFEYAPGVIRSLSEATKMSLEEAKEFGALYGTCCVCGRTLTNEESIEAGIGPVCASKF